jgi:hypothetical protein
LIDTYISGRHNGEQHAAKYTPQTQAASISNKSAGGTTQALSLPFWNLVLVQCPILHFYVLMDFETGVPAKMVLCRNLVVWEQEVFKQEDYFQFTLSAFWLLLMQQQ